MDARSRGRRPGRPAVSYQTQPPGPDFAIVPPPPIVLSQPQMPPRGARKRTIAIVGCVSECVEEIRVPHWSDGVRDVLSLVHTGIVGRASAGGIGGGVIRSWPY